jgi:hypothetical protein
VRPKQARASSSAATEDSRATDELCSPGKALGQRAGDVVEQTLLRVEQHGVGAASREAIPGVSSGSAAQITEASTGTIARWLEGHPPAGDSDSAQQTWRFYGELATREASLNDVIMHCLCWRDAVAEVLQQSATELHVSSEVLSRALRMLQVGTDYGFLRTAAKGSSALGRRRHQPSRHSFAAGSSIPPRQAGVLARTRSASPSQSRPCANRP